MKRVIRCLSLMLLVIAVSAPGVLASTNLTYTYDANGNLIQGDGKIFEYNDANRLVRVRHGDANGPIIAQYFYDYQGQRIKKIENGVTMHYIGKHYETQVGGAVTNTSYYFANGERVGKKDPSGQFYYHSDHLGSTNVITDTSGNHVEHTRYYPFGEIREGGGDKYTYTGKERDKLTSNYYYESREYKSNFAHFTQADIVQQNIHDPQSMNRYAYTRNNPIKFTDPTGRDFVDPNGRHWNKEENYRHYIHALKEHKRYADDAAKAQQKYMMYKSRLADPWNLIPDKLHLNAAKKIGETAGNEMSQQYDINRPKWDRQADPNSPDFREEAGSLDQQRLSDAARIIGEGVEAGARKAAEIIVTSVAVAGAIFLIALL
jgi:RHS repeat-associated protein